MLWRAMGFACLEAQERKINKQDIGKKTRNLIRSIYKGKVVMEKRKLNYHRIVTHNKRNRLTRLHQNGKEPGYFGFRHDITNELSVPGLKIAPKATILSGISELGNPYVLLIRGRDFARRTDGADGRGSSKKRRPGCNDLNKSSTFALT